MRCYLDPEVVAPLCRRLGPSVAEAGLWDVATRGTTRGERPPVIPYPSSSEPAEHVGQRKGEVFGAAGHKWGKKNPEMSFLISLGQ